MKKIVLVCVLLSVLIGGCGGSNSTSTEGGGSASPVPSGTATAVVTPTPSSGGTGTVDFGLVGFAAMGNGTTGGAGYDSIKVTTGTELQAAIDAAKEGGTKRIIYVNGTITLSNSSDHRILLKGQNETSPLANLSIIGVGTTGELNGIGLRMNYVQNIIIKNLKIHHVEAKTGEDAIGIEGPANHIWVDHCELYNSIGDVDKNGEINETDKDYYDGLFDVKDKSEYITFSWNYVHDSYKTSLIGSSDTDDYDRKITFHHNYFKNCNSRLPSYRFGTGHVYNNYYDTVPTSGVNCRMGAKLRIEGNYFYNVKDPICFLDSDVTGYWDVKDNTFDSCSGTQPTTSTGSFAPGYTYTLTPTAKVKTLVQQNAGIGKVSQ